MRVLCPKFLKWLAVLVLALTLGACATTGQNGSTPSKTVKADPWEPMNRAVFSFNETLDEYLIKPVTKAYRAVVPEVVRTAISNVFSNIGDIYTAVNNLLQGKPKEAVSDLGRVVINTTMGVFGIFDIATDAGLEKHKEDFGQTLGVWGVGSGPFVVLPVLGPSTVRDTAGWVVDIKTDLLINQVDDVGVRNSITGVRIVDARSRFLDTEGIVEEAAFDKYSFIRDAYLARRKNMIYDGNPPEERDMEDPSMSEPAPKVESSK